MIGSTASSSPARTAVSAVRRTYAGFGAWLGARITSMVANYRDTEFYGYGEPTAYHSEPLRNEAHFGPVPAYSRHLRRHR